MVGRMEIDTRTDIRIIKLLAKQVDSATHNLRDTENKLYQANMDVRKYESVKQLHEKQVKEAQALLTKYEPDYDKRLREAWARDY
jgi:hypothetical protein